MRIIPEKDLYPHLMSVKAPGQYVGGEYGISTKDNTSVLQCGISFPDLYEIGMSNIALKVIYNKLNIIPGVSCERVFAPGFDFEELLRKLSIPLYTLETGIPLSELDILGFSVGYELSATNILSILDLGGIPLHNDQRSDNDPIIIAGGPSITNPEPLERFIDVFFIGESEYVLDSLFTDLVLMKKRGAGRQDLLERMLKEPSSYCTGKIGETHSSTWSGFGSDESTYYFPIPNLKPVQDNGIVEIMRGCPNGCRFCHAGVFYRPYRMKPSTLIEKEIDRLIHSCGYREITLSSLSSGDYPDIINLVRRLNGRYAGDRVSFSLPSLRINSLTFPLVEELNSVRKSGLTFAVETPLESWQRGINKTIDYDNLMDLLHHAKKSGWRQAKFYFMVGLPVAAGYDECTPISDFLNTIQRNTNLQINANVGTFIPKPHTPFQWARQLTEQESYEKINTIRSNLRSKKIKLGFNSPFQSFLEGLISRGDTGVGELIETAFRAGARFDAWEDLVKKDIWRKVLSDSSRDFQGDIFRERDMDTELPWDSINLGITKEFLKREYVNAMAGVLTNPCNTPCSHPCGVCDSDTRPQTVTNNDTPSDNASLPPPDPACKNVYMFSFSKTGKARFYSHLNVMSIFERSFSRACLHPVFTEGFNPKPKIEFAQPLSLGYESVDEICSVILHDHIDATEFIDRLNRVLPSGLFVLRAILQTTGTQRANKSLMSLYAGSDFRIEFHTMQTAEFPDVDLSAVADRLCACDSGISIVSRTSEYLDIFIPGHCRGGLNGLFKLISIDPFSSNISIRRLKMYRSHDAGQYGYMGNY